MECPANSKVWSNYEGLRLLLLSTHSNCSGSRGNKHTHRPKRLVLIEGADRQGLGHGGRSSPVCMLAHLAHLPGTSRLALLAPGAALGGRAEMLTATHGSP